MDVVVTKTANRHRIICMKLFIACKWPSLIMRNLNTIGGGAGRVSPIVFALKCAHGITVLNNCANNQITNEMGFQSAGNTRCSSARGLSPEDLRRDLPTSSAAVLFVPTVCFYLRIFVYQHIFVLLLLTSCTRVVQSFVRIVVWPMARCLLLISFSARPHGKRFF